MILTLLALWCFQPIPPLPPVIFERAYRNLVYMPGDVPSHPGQRLDIYHPKEGTPPEDGWPYLVIARLSGYTSSERPGYFYGEIDTPPNGLGDPSPLDRLAWNALAQGIAVVDVGLTVVDVTLPGGGANMPPGANPGGAMVDPYLDVNRPMSTTDIVYASQFLAHHADRYDLDPARRVIIGDSAGGETGMWVGLHQDRAGELGSGGVYDATTLYCGTMVLRSPARWKSFKQSIITGAKFVDANDTEYDEVAGKLDETFLSHQGVFSAVNSATRPTPIWAAYNIEPTKIQISPNLSVEPPAVPIVDDFMADTHDSYSGMLLKAWITEVDVRFVTYSEPGFVNGAGNGLPVPWTTGYEDASRTDYQGELFSPLVMDGLAWLQDCLDMEPTARDWFVAQGMSYP